MPVMVPLFRNRARGENVVMYSSFQYNGENIEFEIIYRKRKTVSIGILPPGKITVKAPTGFPEKDIVKLMHQKSSWIIEKMEICRQKAPIDREFKEGELFLFLGREYNLHIVNGRNQKPLVQIRDNRIIVQTQVIEAAVIRQELYDWYREQAGQRITARVEHYKHIIKQQPAKIVVKNQKTRWGSCSSRGNLNFNWRLVMTPAPVLDYIVVHELCHLVFLNHSRQFWNLVESIIPDYKMQKSWLRDNGYRCNF